MASLHALLLWLVVDGIHCIDIQNSNSVSQWWYQCTIIDSTPPSIYTLTKVQVRSDNTLTYISCNPEDWPPYPWTCRRNDTTYYIAPLTVKLTNSLDQVLIFEDIIQNFISAARWNSTYTFVSAPTTRKPTFAFNTDPTQFPVTLPPTLPTVSPTHIPITPTTTTTTTEKPDTPFLGSKLQFPYFVGYINRVLCDVGDDLSCLASIGLPGYSKGTPHHYNVLNFGSYIISNETCINALQFWFNPSQYLSVQTIAILTGSATSSNTEIRIILHNIYADSDIKIFLSTFGGQDDDILSHIINDDWIGTAVSPYTIASHLAAIVRNYWFDGINLNFDATQSIYFDDVATGEIDLILLTESLNSALNRNSLNPYFIITHTASSIFFQKSGKFPNGGFLMLHEFCSHLITWYNIQFYDSGTITYSTFETIFKSHNTSMDNLLLGTNKQNVAINFAKIVIAKSLHTSDANGYIPAITFANIISRAVARIYPHWNTGVMLFDFLADEENDFEYSLTLIPAFLPSTGPTAPVPEPTAPAIYPTVPKYSADENSFDLLNLNSYGWGEWFFLCTMLTILCLCCVGVGCGYHRYQVKDRILTDDQIKDLETNMNKTAISDSWRRLSKLLVRTASVINDRPMEMNEEQAQRVLGNSICADLKDDSQENVELTQPMEEGQKNEDIQQLVGHSFDTKTNIMAIVEEDEESRCTFVM